MKSRLHDGEAYGACTTIGPKRKGGRFRWEWEEGSGKVAMTHTNRCVIGHLFGLADVFNLMHTVAITPDRRGECEWEWDGCGVVRG